MDATRRTIIGKHALLITAKGETEIAGQVFVYDQLREVRVDLENLEVKVLMIYDEAFFRVYKIKPETDSAQDLNKSKELVLRFYNDLLSASMKFTQEEIERLKNQQDKLNMENTETQKIKK